MLKTYVLENTFGAGKKFLTPVGPGIIFFDLNLNVLTNGITQLRWHRSLVSRLSMSVDTAVEFR